MKVECEELYTVTVRTEECLVKLFCKVDGDHYVCVGVQALLGEIPPDLSIFLLNQPYESLDYIRYIAYAILSGGTERTHPFQAGYGQRVFVH